MTRRKRSAVEAGDSEADKPLRADARRNRARILEVAETVLAEKGTSVSTEEIAREAGVGIGTVFRHFPTKEALLEAILVGRMQRLAEEADALATAEDPGAALFAFFTRVVDQSGAKNAFSEALAAAGVDVMNATSEVRKELRRAVDTLLARAQKVGAVREDIRSAELMALLAGTSRAAEHVGWDREVQARLLMIVFDGLRPQRRR